MERKFGSVTESGARARTEGVWDPVEHPPISTVSMTGNQSARARLGGFMDFKIEPSRIAGLATPTGARRSTNNLDSEVLRLPPILLGGSGRGGRAGSQGRSGYRPPGNSPWPEESGAEGRKKSATFPAPPVHAGPLLPFVKLGSRFLRLGSLRSGLLGLGLLKHPRVLCPVYTETPRPWTPDSRLSGEQNNVPERGPPRHCEVPRCSRGLPRYARPAD